MATYRAVLWDWDGALYGSDGPVLRAVNALREHHGLSPETYESFRHRPHNNFSRYIEQGVPWNEEECRDFFYKHYDNSSCTLTEGALDILQHLRSEGVPCGIVSAHHATDIVAKLEQFGIDDHFVYVIGGAWQKKKALAAVCRALRVPHSETLFIGDILSDVLEGNAAGVTTVLYAPPDSPHKGEAHHHITHLTELKTLLKA